MCVDEFVSYTCLKFEQRRTYDPDGSRASHSSSTLCMFGDDEHGHGQLEFLVRQLLHVVLKKLHVDA